MLIDGAERQAADGTGALGSGAIGGVMRILIITQNEYMYLPTAIARVCQSVRDQIVCIVVAPAMGPHGCAVKGLFRHVSAFGLCATTRVACRVMWAKLLAACRWRVKGGRCASIASAARAFGVPCQTVDKVNSSEFHMILDRYAPDLLISMSCPQIVGEGVRKRFAKGCINVHGAPLPRYRGLMPAFWALRYGETKTAATVHDLADKLDNGEILLQREVVIAPGDTWDSLVRKTKAAGADALVEVVRQIQNGTECRQPNPDSEATYFSFPTARDRKAFLRAGRRFF